MSKKRKTYSPEEKANAVLEILREESTLNKVSQKYGVSPQLISRRKTEFLENMPAVFDKKASQTEELKKEHAAEKEKLVNQIDQLTVDINWLKKNNSRPRSERKKGVN